MDFIQQWLDERTIADPQASVSRSDAYGDYKSWCGDGACADSWATGGSSRNYMRGVSTQRKAVASDCSKGCG